MTSIPVPAPEAAPAEPTGTKIVPMVIAFVVGTAVSIGLGVYGRLHTPSGHAVNIAGFSSGAAAKAFLASVVMALAIVRRSIHESLPPNDRLAADLPTYGDHQH
ncbi:MAG: DUF6529 family protein, partial [Propionibacteriaceae bacterium]